MGAEPDGVYLLLPLVLNPRRDEILGEDVPFQEIAVVLLEGVEGVEGPLQAVRLSSLSYLCMNGTTIIVLLSWFP